MTKAFIAREREQGAMLVPVPSRDSKDFPFGLISPGALVPIGTVLPWWHPAPEVPLPEGFEVCDGRTLVAARHGFTRQDGGRLNEAIKLPDLRNAFVLGADPEAPHTRAATPGDAPTDAPGLGMHGGSNAPRGLDHHHTVSLSHAHGRFSTEGTSQPTTGSTTLMTDPAGEHGHSVPQGSPIYWVDDNPDDKFPTLSEPKQLWRPILPPHATDPVGSHTHSVSAHTHCMAHTHQAEVPGYTGLAQTEGVDTAGARALDVLPRYVGLLMIMRVK